ncbi:GNAT family N-acetyltransferase [Bacillus suaedaesalsae]|uniref:GNAT family N-acetyltransferase n=1 Tax=Bacillus suaedaesalsae TaxID=2810349 RepID=A0ABS2DFB0_9BACI|nr:GNAT family protein [Bacillus suaedaesalsae]MBM6617142.1 GNAT family N-acetyltransferase [Bacillus suaedaesalsae]
MIRFSLLKGDNVYLDRLKEEDVPAITSWYQEEEFTRNMDALLAIPKRERDIQKMVELDSEKDYLFAVRLNGTNEIVGVVGLDGILWNHRTAWVSIGIGNNNRKKGIGKEALRLAMDLAFHEFNLYRLQLTVFEYNTRAIALYESLGFQKEGTYRSFLERDNLRYDMLLYGVLRDEYLAL